VSVLQETGSRLDAMLKMQERVLLQRRMPEEGLACA